MLECLPAQELDKILSRIYASILVVYFENHQKKLVVKINKLKYKIRI